MCSLPFGEVSPIPRFPPLVNLPNSTAVPASKSLSVPFKNCISPVPLFVSSQAIYTVFTPVSETPLAKPDIVSSSNDNLFVPLVIPCISST